MLAAVLGLTLLAPQAAAWTTGRATFYGKNSAGSRTGWPRAQTSPAVRACMGAIASAQLSEAIQRHRFSLYVHADKSVQPAVRTDARAHPLTGAACANPVRQ